MAVTRDALIERQRILADFGEFALRSDDLQEVLTEGCRLVSRALGADLSKVLELEPGGETAVMRAGVGWKAGTVGRQFSLRDQSSETFALRLGKPVITQDINQEDRFEFPEFLKEHGVVAIVNAPIFLPGGKAYGLLQVDAKEPRGFDHEDIEFLRTYCAVLGPVIDRLRIVNDLKQSDERFRLVVENAHGFGIILSDPDDIITDWFPGAVEVFGWSEEEAVGRPVASIFTPGDQESGIPQREVKRAREMGKAPNIRWHVTKSGRRVFVDGQTIVLRNPDDTVRGYLKIGQDLTERKLHEERQTVLLAELQHRVRNVLAMIASIVKRADVDLGTREFRDRLSGRIASMARTQALLTRAAGAGVDVAGIVGDELAAQDAAPARIHVAGPQITLSAKAAEVVTLAVHELATNASKYGAIAQPDGHIDVRWQLQVRDEQDWLELEWRETNVEIASDAVPRSGFGTELITRRVPYELGGEGELVLEEDGLRCRIAFPLKPGDSILQTNSPPLPKTARDEL
ncbi:Blue-light-activated histidine kinase [Sphingomonas jeddahensis]|uniref:histidine kinase n=2 Tax=Sphingomonas jeddahensis TaxID=1915074 RepID=A0A1V2EX28_9SPHN|nr:Blue-light-activated histidine kinase [Sphingomonas jeddahensis]